MCIFNKPIALRSNRISLLSMNSNKNELYLTRYQYKLV